MATRRDTRLPGDTRPLVLTVTVLVGILALTSFAAGVPGLWELGTWARLPGLMPGLVPVIVDGGLIVFSLVAVVRRARQQSTWFAWLCLAVLTTGSITAQVLHVFAGSTEITAITVIAGALIAGAFPATVFAATHALIDLAIAPSSALEREEDEPAEDAELVRADISAPEPEYDDGAPEDLGELSTEQPEHPEPAETHAAPAAISAPPIPDPDQDPEPTPPASKPAPTRPVARDEPRPVHQAEPSVAESTEREHLTPAELAARFRGDYHHLSPRDQQEAKRLTVQALQAEERASELGHAIGVNEATVRRWRIDAEEQARIKRRRELRAVQ